MGGGKKKTETVPWGPSQPYILDNLADTKATYDANQPKLQGFSTQMQDTYGRLAPGAEAGIMGAQSLVNSNLSGANLMGNPFLEGIIDRSGRSITDRVNSQFTAGGRYGSGAHTGVLTRELADAENALRFQNYGVERDIQQRSIGDAQNLMGGATGLLNNAAQIPWIGTTAQTGGTMQLSSPYSTRTETTSPSLGSSLMGLAGAGLGAAGAIGSGGQSLGAFFKSDGNKKNIGPVVGTEPVTGVPLHAFTYKGDEGNPQVGPIAQDVEKVRPDAVATMPNGEKAVDYGKLDVAPPTSPMAAIDVPQIAKPKRGFSDYANEFVNPTNGLGLLGQFLMAGAEGTPFQALGQNLLAARQINQRDQLAERRIAADEAQNAELMELRRQQIAGQNAPPPPTAGLRAWQEWNSLPPDQREAARPFFNGASLDPNVQRPLIDMRGDRQAELARERAALRPAGGGSSIPPATAARYRAEAAAAIARGAPAAAVNARLAQILGGQ